MPLIPKQLRKEYKLAAELREATRKVCIQRVKDAFGVEWSDLIEDGLRRQSSDQRPMELLRELGRIGNEIRQLAKEGRWPFVGDNIRIWVYGYQPGPEGGARFIDLTDPTERTPVLRVSAEGEPLSPVEFVRFPAPPSQPLTKSERQRLVADVRRHGLLCRCGELPGVANCPVLAGDVAPGDTVRLLDGTIVRCARFVQDPAIAAVSLLLQPVGHFADAIKRRQGSCSVHFILQKEADTIRDARERLELAPGAPRRRRPNRKP